MATYEELKNKYRERFPEAAVAPTIPVGTPATSYEELKAKYNERSPVKEPVKEEAKPQELKWEQYKGPDIVDRQPEPLWRKAAKFIISSKTETTPPFREKITQKIESLFGLDKPMPEKTIAQKMMDQERATQSYYREKEFTEMLDQAKQINPEDFELPEGYKEPGAIGQVLEGIHSGFRSMLLPAVGYFTESMGRKIGSPGMVKWGMESGDAAMVDYMKRPELMRPEDLKPFLDGGWTDLRAYGRTIGEIIPFMGTVIALSTAGGLVGGPGGALAGGWASAAAIEQGNAYKSYIDSGIAPAEAADASFIYGLIAGGIENMMGVRPAGIANKILNPTRLATNSFRSYAMKSLPNMSLGTIKMAIGEGSEEVLQQLTEDMMAKWAGSEEGISTLKELGEQFIAGTVGSLPFGAVSTFKMPSIPKAGVAPITPVTPEQLIQKPEIAVPEPEPEEVIRVREEEAKIVMAEEKATKALKEAVTGESITIEKSYSGVKDGVDSGFRTVEEAYARGYADMKGGEVLTFTNEVLNNPYVTEGHKAVLNYLKEKSPDEVADIEKRYESRIALQAEATGKFAAGPDLTQPVDDFIRGKLTTEGYDSLIYTRGLDAVEYQIFNKVTVKPAVAPAPEAEEEIPAGLQELENKLVGLAKNFSTYDAFKDAYNKAVASKGPSEVKTIANEIGKYTQKEGGPVLYLKDIYDKAHPIADLIGKKLTVEPGAFEGVPIVDKEGKPITQKEKVKEAVKEKPIKPKVEEAAKEAIPVEKGIIPKELQPLAQEKARLEKLLQKAQDTNNFQEQLKIGDKIRNIDTRLSQAVKGVKEVKPEEAIAPTPVEPKVEKVVEEIKAKEVLPKIVEAIPEAKGKEISPKAHLTAKQVVGKNRTLPILESFVVQNGKLMATDLEVSVRLNTDLKDGAYKIVGKDAIASDISIEDFPIVPEVKGKTIGKVLSGNLADTIKRANLSKSKESHRYELQALSLEIKDNKMIVATTDSFRLFREEVMIKGENANIKLMIESTKLPNILASMEDSVIEIYDGKEMVHFRSKFGDITVKKIEGDFPAYEEIYPVFTDRYVFDRKQLLATLKELKPFVDYTKGITLTYKDGKIELSAENTAEKISKKLTLNTSKQKINKVNPGSANDGVLVMQIKGDTSPKVEQFKFNVNYLIDVMGALKEDRVFMYSSDEIADTPKLFNTVDEMKSVAKLKGSANATIGEFREGEEVELGGMDKVKPIEFPELVELTRDLMGRVPEISKRLRTSLGKFYATEKGRIKLTPAIFKDEVLASRVLAHEIGHLIDYLPHQTLKRGNLLGSLLSLRHFLKNQFGEVEIKNNEIREELKVVTKYWRPYEEAESTASYINYRNSSRELYADAVSLLFNSPGTLERLAPKFYKGFFDALDAKPEVKNAYFDIQEVLSHDRATLIELRRKRTKEMFDRASYKAQELQKIQDESRKFRLKHYWDRLGYTMRSINQPIYDKVNQAEKEGKYIPDDENPKYLLSGQNYLSGEIKARLEEKVQPVMNDLIKNEIDWQVFGEFLLYERVAKGDRSEFANPGGITKTDATERIATIKQNFGEEKFKSLEKNADSFRNFLKELSGEAFKEGMITPEMAKTMEANEKYSPFQVVEYMEKKVSWRVMPQIGTLKDINNPANSLVLKAISTIRAIETQKNRMATFKMLENNFSDEIKEAELQFTGKAQRPIETREEGMGMITYYKEGKLRGKYVDQYIAKSLERDSIARNKAMMMVVSPVSYQNKKLYRPLFVIYNTGWIPFNFIRDFMRFWKNTPDLSFIGAAKRYGQAFRAAKVRAFGMSKKESAQEIEARNMIRKLEKEKVLSVTWNDILSGQEVEDAQIEAALEDVGLVESKKEIPSIYKPVAAILERFKILPLLKGIRKTGDLVETLPKVAGYLELEGKMQPEKMREFIRKNIGSPDFLEKGHFTAVSNNIFLFSNAFIQAVTADAYIAKNPTTRSGFWFKTAKVILTPKILMFAALMGAFGDDVKELMSDASEYDMTNYFVIPVGKDTNSGKTIYLRIPMDETSRLIGGLAWKIMRGSSNDQAFGRDVMDIASLFGGQLPTWSPAISVPVSAFNFAAGQNPYDSFRGRMVLTEEQMQAGGMYALKPFLLWEFQQVGGNVFTKFYAGEQTPTKKSAGEQFLQLPVISNVAGRFIRISDYGQLEKYRAKLYEIKGEKARERIDENKLINDYVKKYQEEEGEMGELSQDLIMDVLGHAVSSREEKLRANNIRKKFKISIEKGKADPKINAMISAVSNEEKVTLLRVYKEIMSEKDFEALRTELLKYKIISTNVLRELNKPFEP